MPTTGVAKYPYPNSSALPDVPGDILLLGQRVAKMNGAGVGYSATTADRTAKVTNGDVFEGYLDYDAQTTITYKYTASAWKAWESDWISYTPTLTNFTIGTGGVAANTAAYQYTAGNVRMKGSAFLGTAGASVGSGVSMTIPVNAATLPFSSLLYIGVVTIFDTSAPATFNGFVRANTTSVSSVQLMSQSAGAPANTTSTVPMTWAAGDGIAYEFTYRPA